MAEPPDLESLARRYLDLWQQYWSQAASDPETSEALTRLMSAMGNHGGFGWPLPGTTPFPGWPGGTQAHDDGGAAQDGASTTRSSPRDGGGDVGALERRLAAVEERLNELDARLAKGGRKSPTRSRKGG